MGVLTARESAQKLLGTPTLLATPTVPMVILVQDRGKCKEIATFRSS